MNKKWLTTAASIAMSVLATSAAFAQNAATVIANATRAMGITNVNAITYYGSAANYNLGQNNDADHPWPQTNLNDYKRTIDFTRPSSLATAVTWAVPVTGGVARQGDFTQNVTADSPWAMQLEIWVTPWGFLKGAAANNASVQQRTIDGRRFHVVTWNAPQKSPSGLNYRLVGYINGDNLVERVETWVENPVFGDMHVEALYRNYRESLEGLKYPANIVQNRAGWPFFTAQILGAHAQPGSPGNLVSAMGPQPPAAAAGAQPGGPAGGTPPPHRAEKLADGVYRITGGYVALAVEFSDHVLVYEPAGQNEARARSLLDTVKQTIPNKPIRYAVLSHHHFDHTGGIAAVVEEGATIVTHEVNKAFFEKALNAPRTLAPDGIARSGRKPVIETVGDKRVFQEGNQVVELHRIKGLPHAEGMLIAYLPNHGIVAYADMFNLPPPNDPVPNPPVVGTVIFVENLERLGLRYETLVSVHAPNPDRPITRRDLLSSIGRQ